MPIKPGSLSGHITLLAKNHYGAYTTTNVVAKLVPLLEHDRLMRFDALLDETGHPRNNTLRTVLAGSLVNAVRELHAPESSDHLMTALAITAATTDFVGFVNHVLGMLATVIVRNKDKDVVILPEVDPMLAERISAIT